jgi:hypothetical protein
MTSLSKSLDRVMYDNPRTGWIRADSGPDAETLERMISLQTENSELRAKVSLLERSFPRSHVADIAGFDEQYHFVVRGKFTGHSSPTPQTTVRSWQQLFAMIGPHLFQPLNEDTVSWVFGEAFFIKGARTPDAYETEDEGLQTIRIQFLALGLIDVQSLHTVSKTMALFWSLTDAGRNLLIQLRTVKTLK